MILIDGTNQILGRVASYAAKQALFGETIRIVNCEKIIVTGRKKFLEQHYEERKERGHPYDGPFYPKLADRLVRRVIRGMLPYKQARGREAFKRVMCYRGVPLEFKDIKITKIPGADASKLQTPNYLEIQHISTFLGK